MSHQAHSQSSEMKRQLPLVVVLGASACGKSKLAIDLATRFGGEIISADSMQVYRGLDIVTNKVTPEEMAQAKHHMMSFLDPSQYFSVVDFRNRSLSIIDEIMMKNSIPIVVGGTNYYIESLIWKNFLVDAHGINLTSPQGDSESGHVTLIDSEVNLCNKLPIENTHTEEDYLTVEKFFSKPIYMKSFSNVDSTKLWTILEKVDPETAHVCHPKNKRGVIRFLQVYQNTGKKYSDIIEDQNKSNFGDEPSLGGPLRFEKTCVLWLDCDKQILMDVCDRRVDQMLTRGLLKELEDFNANHNEHRLKSEVDPSYTKGIFQMIGFKEFHDYLILSEEAKATDEGKNLLAKSIEKMKLATRQYVKKQVKWLRSRFLSKGVRDLPPIFKLTTSYDEDLWIETVRNPAIKIVESFIDDKPLSEELMKYKAPVVVKEPFKPGKYYCEACDRLFIGERYIQYHLLSRRHAKTVSALTVAQR